MMITGLRGLVGLSLVFGFMGTLRAEQLTSTCRITAVDAAAHTVTLVRKTATGEKTGVAKVGDALKVTLDNQPSSLTLLTLPVDATVVYDTDARAVVEVRVTKSTATTGATPPLAIAPFAPSTTAPGVLPESDSRRWFGYHLGSDAIAWTQEVSTYTNVIYDYTWGTERDGRATLRPRIEAAKNARQKLWLGIGSKTNMDSFLKLGIGFVEEHREVITAVCVDNPVFYQLKPEETQAFVAAFKSQLPNVPLGLAMVDTAKDQQVYPIPEQVDFILLDCLDRVTVAGVLSTAAEVLPIWVKRAAGRPLILAWDSFAWQGSGMVTKCERGVFQAMAQVAEQNKLAGLLILSYGPTPFEGHTFEGIRSRPDLVAEIKAISERWKSRDSRPFATLSK